MKYIPEYFATNTPFCVWLKGDFFEETHGAFVKMLNISSIKIN